MKKILISGNEAMAEGAIQAGCTFYAGYPITPQNEIPAYMAKRMPEVGGIFIQAESELAAISMIFGAAAAGARAMTSSSSPGISLKQEGISYIAGAELPAVIVNVMRGGPGLGNIWPAQSDYFQATRGGGHGDYHCIVLAPESVQEAYDFMPSAFTLADRYRNPAMILADGMLGQMMEPLRLSQAQRKRQAKGRKPWALTGCRGRKPNIVKSFFLLPGDLEIANLKLQKKYALIKDSQQRYEGLHLSDAKVVLIAYGTMARIAKTALAKLRENNIKAGLFRPVTLWPFPERALRQLVGRDRAKFLVVEMSYGQMVDDVRLCVNGQAEVDFFGRSGGGIPAEEEIIKRVLRLSR